jgi:alternate signal-mediated exported protein
VSVNDQDYKSHRREQRRNGIIAGVVGVALLFSGTTFALWSESGSYTNNGDIQSGNLSLTKNGSIAFYDVSADRKNPDSGDTLKATGKAGHVITNLANYRIVPGDQIAVVYPFTAGLKGGNLVAQLKADFSGGASGPNSFTAENGKDVIEMTYGIVVADTLTTNTGTVDRTSTTTANLGYVASADSDEKAASQPIAVFPTDSVNMKVVFYVTFINDATANMNALEKLKDVKITLEQARSGGGFFA